VGIHIPATSEAEVARMRRVYLRKIVAILEVSYFRFGIRYHHTGQHPDIGPAGGGIGQPTGLLYYIDKNYMNAMTWKCKQRLGWQRGKPNQKGKACCEIVERQLI
jgi:hypothetical protein